MPNELLSIELKAQTIEVKSVLSLVGLAVQGDRFTGSYIIKRVADGIEDNATKFTVDRSLAKLEQSVTDWIAQGAAFAEAWRQEDVDNRAADKLAADTEAIRWAGLTPEEQKAEVEAALLLRQASIDSAPLLDPTPSGP